MVTTDIMATGPARRSSCDLTWMCFPRRSKPARTTRALVSLARELLPRIRSYHGNDAHLRRIDQHNLLVYARELVKLRDGIVGENLVGQCVQINHRRDVGPYRRGKTV